ncbi:putative protein (DUF4160 domain) [Campylobacter iguaniorum]|uniref:DUF4160 domain-containing protein n=1 Tax=Campylobacter iguaniorum TaxID=1244531 RepID=UPI00073A24EA|nr:DUF4160 domain-containing protein [Campylobacter iguaniorum]ALV25063.1 putative protein (DUF4160 domain) [Campylobacter iguaniorum]
MPTLLNINGFRFFFYANEHDPRHIHVLKDDRYAKINLDDLSVVNSTFKPKDMKFVIECVRQNQENFIRGWDEYFSKR